MDTEDLLRRIIRQELKRSPPMVGSAEYLKVLSGYRQSNAIKNWCRKNGIQFLLDARGWPVTTPMALERALDPGVKSEPDWSACDRRGRRGKSDAVQS